MVETLRFQCRGCGFDPWSETRIPRAMWSKTKTNKQNHKVVGDAVGPGGSGHLVIQMLPSAIVPIHRACTSPVPIILCAKFTMFFFSNFPIWRKFIPRPASGHSTDGAHSRRSLSSGSRTKKGLSRRLEGVGYIPRSNFSFSPFSFAPAPRNPTVVAGAPGDPGA